MLISVLAVFFIENALVCCSYSLWQRHYVVICNAVLPTEFAPSRDLYIGLRNILDSIISPRCQPTCRIAFLSLSRTAHDIVR